MKNRQSLFAPLMARRWSNSLSASAILVFLGSACGTNINTGWPVEETSQIAQPLITDPLYSLQNWHYGAIRVPEAWGITTGSSSVVIAVLDSGKENHADLNAKWVDGYDFYYGAADHYSIGPYHHGSHVAGTLGASANNGQGGVGICWNCLLMPVLTRGTIVGPFDPLEVSARAIRYAAGENVDDGKGHIVKASRRADVINISLGNRAGPCDSKVQAAVNVAVAAGVPVVVATSNIVGGDSDASHYFWPTCNNVIVVTSVDQFGNPEPYATLGNGVTIAAPGGSAMGGKEGYGELVSCPPDPAEPRGTGTHGVVSSWITLGDGAAPCYRHWAGTSMATPHVSGVVALMKSRDPTLTPAQIKTILQKTAKTTACTGTGSGTCGAGMVDAYKAVAATQFDLKPGEVSCEASGGGYFSCDASPTSGLAPYTLTWSGVSNAGIDPRYVHSFTTSGTCTKEKNAKVQLTAMDALGRTVTRSVPFTCWNVPV